MKKRSAAHNLIQKQGKRRDLYYCQICGSSINPEGHHIIDYQFGGGANIDNIITLCRKCHKELHKGNIDLVVF